MNFTLELPPNYRAREVLAFHGRDPQGMAEQVGTANMRKGFVLSGLAVTIEISLGQGMAHCNVDADGELPEDSGETLPTIARNLLGLIIDPSPFEAVAKDDALFGSLVARQSGLRVPQAATPFEALTWAVIGQQINLPFAIALRRTLIQLAGRRHSGGLWCYPEPTDILRIDASDPAWHKFSQAKTATVLRVARLVAEGELVLDEMKHWPSEEIYSALLAIKGIGPWTANYTLMRGFASPDCSLHGDAGIKTALQRQSDGLARTRTEIEILLERYKPHRSMAAAHLWASLVP